MRAFRRILGAVAALGLAAMASPAALAQGKINVGYVTASDFVPLLVAKEKGFFEKRGLDVEPKRIPIITNIPPALVSGDLQMGSSTMPLLLQANDGGLDMRLVAGAARHLKETSKIALMVRSTLKIEKPEDLKGKKIGVAGFNSTMDVFIKKWLKLKGVDPKDVTFVEAAFPQMPDLLKGGTVDAVTIAFGIRNVTHIDQALAEMYRVLRPGGRFICLEFSHVVIPGLAQLYDAFSFNVIPRLGELVAGDAESYRYLVESIRKFPEQERFAGMLRAAGLERVQVRNLSGGIAALHSGWRL